MDDVLEDSAISGLFQSVTELALARTYQIDVSFETRFRVWTEQILPDRMNEIRQKGSIEYIHRMLDNLFCDDDRLTNRIITEGRKYGNEIRMLERIRAIDEVVEEYVTMYLEEINRIKLMKLNRRR